VRHGAGAQERPPQGLFDDRLFGAPSETVTGDDLFALSDDMKRFLDTEIAADIRVKGHRQALFDALYTKHRLQLNYDGAATRGAAATFSKRAGNCLSLVIMTAAFAKAMEIPVRYQSVYLDEALSRNEDIYFFVGHVNLILGNAQDRRRDSGASAPTRRSSISFRRSRRAACRPARSASPRS
jgi:hypothetical protein